MSRARQVANFDPALFAADEISGDKVSGGTIGAGTWEGTDVAVAHGGTGASTHTANNVLVGAGTSAITSIAPGADGQVLTSTGTVWQSEAAATGGGLVHLATANFGTGYEVTSLRNLFTATYQSYWVVIRSQQVGTDTAELRMRFSTDASTDLSTSNYQIVAEGRTEDTQPSGYAYSDANHFELNTNLGNATGEAQNSTFTINGTQDSSAYANFHGTGSSHGGSVDYLFGWTMAGEYEVAGTTITGIYLYSTPGVFAGGSCSVFGIKES